MKIIVTFSDLKGNIRKFNNIEKAVGWVRCLECYTDYDSFRHSRCPECGSACNKDITKEIGT